MCAPWGQVMPSRSPIPYAGGDLPLEAPESRTAVAAEIHGVAVVVDDREYVAVPAIAGRDPADGGSCSPQFFLKPASLTLLAVWEKDFAWGPSR